MKLEDQLTPGNQIVQLIKQPDDVTVLNLPSRKRIVLHSIGEQHIVADGDVQILQALGWIATPPAPAPDVAYGSEEPVFRSKRR